MRVSARGTLLLTTALTLVGGAAVQAQVSPPPSQPSQVQAPSGAAPQSQVEEVVVTARRTTESLQSTPIAVTALSARELQARQVQNVGDLGQVVPSLHVTGGSSGGNSNAQFFIRGVGQADYLPTNDPAVGVYVDGVYIARTTGDLFDLADVQQIEVLRGPQGTLFGKNTEAGAISVTTKRPTGAFDGMAELTLGTDFRHDAKVSVEGPLVKDQLAGSLTVVSRNQDGYGRSLTTGDDLGNIDLQSIRASLNYYGSDVFDYYVSGDYTYRHEHTRPVHLNGVFPSTTRATYQSLVLNRTGQSYTPALTNVDPLDSYAGPFDHNDLNVGGVSGVGTLKLPYGLTLKSITAYRGQHALTQVDNDGSAVQIADYDRRITEDQVSQEFQLNGKALDGRLDYVGGVFYQHENAKIAIRQFGFAGFYQALLAAGVRNQTPFTAFSNVKQQDDSYAGYVHANLKLTSKLSITGGVRYTDETKDFSQFAYYPDNNLSIYLTPARGPLPALTLLAAHRTFNATTPTAGVEFQATKDAFFYFTYSQGFKTGGFDGRPIAGLSAPSAFSPEKVTSYEGGAKLEFLDRRLRVNSAVYYADYDNLQVTAAITQPNGLTTNVTTNVGAAEIKGAELETVFIPIPGLQLGLNGSYTDAKFTRLNPGTPFTLSDHLVQTPKWIANLSGQYTQQIAGRGSIVYRLDYDFTSKVFNDLPNSYRYTPAGTGIVANGAFTLPTRQPAYGLLNARVAFTTADDKWTAAVSATNLSDERYRTYGFSSTAVGFSESYYGPPREIAFTLSRRF